MDCLLDTNVLLRGLDRRHPMCPVVRFAVKTLRRQGGHLLVAPQNLIEFWAVATRPVEHNGLGMSVPQAAAQIGRLKRFFLVLSETAGLYAEWERLVVQHQVIGRTTHDARLVAAMNVHGLENHLTFNTQHFARFPGINAIHPQEVVTEST